MKTVHSFPIVLLAFLLWVTPARANVYSINVVGYANIVYSPGSHLIGNPLNQAPNTLSNVMPVAPHGTTMALWDSTAEKFFGASTYVAGSGWTLNLLLEVGTGALMTTPAAFTNTFVGQVLTGPGPNDINPPVPPVLEPGVYLLSSLFPAANRTFEDMIGRSPVAGEFVFLLNSQTQVYSTTVFTGNGWNNGAPSLQIGEAAFFGLGGAAVAPVWIPEPSVFTLLSMAAVAVLARKRMR